MRNCLVNSHSAKVRMLYVLSRAQGTEVGCCAALGRGLFWPLPFNGRVLNIFLYEFIPHSIAPESSSNEAQCHLVVTSDAQIRSTDNISANYKIGPAGMTSVFNGNKPVESARSLPSTMVTLLWPHFKSRSSRITTSRGNTLIQFCVWVVQHMFLIHCFIKMQ